MNVLVTGGAGYVGSHCVRRLIDAGHTVTIYDNMSAGHRQAVPDGVHLVDADLNDIPTLNTTLETGFDAVMHFAASLDVGESVRTPLKYYVNNVSNTIGMLELMKKHNVKNIVFSSTAAVYGVPEQVPITEDLPKDPTNPYGHTKLAMEWALSDNAQWGLGSCALRYFNAAGAAPDGTIGEDHNPEFHLIPLVLKTALGQRENISIYGTDYPTEDGTCVRDYIHVEDLADAHLKAIENITPGLFSVYNVGTGSGISVREIIEAAREVTGKPIPVIESERRPGDPPKLYADPTKLKTELGWKPQYTDIRTTIETAWKWHLNHPDGFAC